MTMRKMIHQPARTPSTGELRRDRPKASHLARSVVA